MGQRFNTPEAAQDLGRRIRRARKSKGFTLVSLGLRTQVHHGQISRIERGEMATIGTNVLKICKELGLSPDPGHAPARPNRLGSRIDALLVALPTAEPALTLMIDALEDLVEQQVQTVGDSHRRE